MKNFLSLSACIAGSLAAAACGRGAARTAEDTGPSTTLAYAAYPDPFPRLTLTPGRSACDSAGGCQMRDTRDPVIPLANGAVLWGLDGLILVDSMGRKTAALGRRGKGPGEYGRVYGGSVDAKGRITIMSSDIRRIRYDANGKHLETAQMPLPQGLIGMKLIDHDIYLLRAHNPTSDTSKNASLEKLSDDGHSYTPLFQIHSSVKMNASGGMPLALFPSFPLMDIDTTRHVYMAEAGKYAVGRYSESGQLQFTISVDVAPAPVTKEAIAATMPPQGRMSVGRSAQIDAMVNSEFNRQRDEAIRNAPRFLPVIDRMVALTDGTLWIRRFALRTADSARWDAFSGAGKPMGTITTSNATAIRGGNANRLLIMNKDSMDLPMLRWYTVAVAKVAPRIGRNASRARFTAASSTLLPILGRL